MVKLIKLSKRYFNDDSIQVIFNFIYILKFKATIIICSVFISKNIVNNKH
jgi:hypothetical protein